MEYFVLEAKSGRRKLRVVVHLFEFSNAPSLMGRQVARWRDCYLFPVPLLRPVLSRVRIIIEEAESLRDLWRLWATKCCLRPKSPWIERKASLPTVTCNLATLTPWELTATVEIENSTLIQYEHLHMAPAGQMGGRGLKVQLRQRRCL